MEMATREARENMARRGFEAFNAVDGEAVTALLTEDVEVFSSPELANAGTFHGHDGYMKWIRPWAEAWQGLQMDVKAITPLGERHVVAEVNQIGQGRAGIEVSMDVAFLFEVTEEDLASFLALLPNKEQAIAMARDRES
jgi:ketosteroid isomerase-like protein